ncbi:MAG: hypothetical protein HN348_20020, partial [Proteobacteria bacterium]|nr:hypothetical protein [Pseudomonadota bacterium]
GLEDGIAGTAATSVNHRPSATPALSTPIIVTTDTTITCSPNGADLDGHPISYSYIWSNSAGVVLAKNSGNDSTLDIVPHLSGALTEGETVTCQVATNDGIEDGLAAEVSAQLNNRPTVSPSLSQDPVPTTDILTCSPNGFDSDGDNLTFAYEWLNSSNIVFATDDGADSTIDISTHIGTDLTEGEMVTCRITPNDGHEDGDTEEASAQTNNRPTVGPTIDNNPVATIGTLTCTANGADGDSDGLSYFYEWVDDTDTTFATDAGAESTIDITTYLSTHLSEGETITCRVTANDGYEDGDTAEVTSQVNNRPIVAPTLDHDFVGTTGSLTCTPHGYDGDGDNMTYSFEWIEGTSTVFVTDTGADSTIDIPTYLGTELDEGEVVTCRVIANDSLEDGPSAEASSTLNNLPTVAPVLDKDPVPTNSTLTCTANGTDSDGDNLTFAYEWVESAGAVFATDTGTDSTIDIATYLNSDLSEGETVTCRVTANDGYQDGLSAEASVAINHQPTVTPTLDNNPVRTEGTVTCSPNGNDGDGHNLSYSFEWVDGADAVFATDAGVESTIDIANYLGNELSEGETVTCRVTANDGHQDSATEEVSTKVNNRPSITPSLDSDPVSTIGTLTCTPNGVDDDSEALTYTYEWVNESDTVFVNDTGATSTIDIPTYLSTDLVEGEMVTCRVIANDGHEESTSAQASAALNNRPTVTPALDHNPVTTVGVLTCTANGTDNDGDSITYSYEWVDDTGAVFATDTGVDSTIDISTHYGVALSDGELVVCRVIANDGIEDGPAAEALANVNNRPTVTPTLDEDQVATIDTLTCTPNSYDADSDVMTYSYEWVEQTGVVFATDEGDSSTIDISAYLGTDLTEGETVTCRVIANDGREDGPVAEASSQVNNQPTVTLSLNNDPVATVDSLVCTANGTDHDGDSMTFSYEWKNSSDAVFATDTGGDSTVDIATYLGNELAEGETVTCHVVANDGHEDGPVAEVSAQVNHRPTVSVVLDKDFALTTDSVTCTPTGADDDGHSVQYTYEWTAPSGTFSTEATID